MHSNNNQELFENLDYFMEENQLDKVLKISEQILQTDKNNELALYYGGMAYCVLEEYTKGINYLKQVRDEYEMEANIVIGMFCNQLSYIKKDKKYNELLIKH